MYFEVADQNIRLGDDYELNLEGQRQTHTPWLVEQAYIQPPSQPEISWITFLKLELEQNLI
jgi:hypothetical protein